MSYIHTSVWIQWVIVWVIHSDLTCYTHRSQELYTVISGVINSDSKNYAQWFNVLYTVTSRVTHNDPLSVIHGDLTSYTQWCHEFYSVLQGVLQINSHTYMYPVFTCVWLLRWLVVFIFFFKLLCAVKTQISVSVITIDQKTLCLKSVRSRVIQMKQEFSRVIHSDVTGYAQSPQEL